MRARHRRIPPGAIKIDLPNVVQLRDYTCGPAALLAIGAHYGVGPLDEGACERELGIARDGTDPEHIRHLARRWGLSIEEHAPMSDDQLLACLRRRRPVVMMLQAWGGARVAYERSWKHGHWVVAVGFDREGVYVEDPLLHAERGYLGFDELAERWHDWGPRKERIHRYGIALWKPGITRSVYARRARRLE
jgi:predicted double-glycine peptidase